MNESRKQFSAWWNHPDQAELRRSCATGWAIKIWNASRGTVDVKLPEMKMLKDYLSEVTMREREDILVGLRLEFFRNIRAAGIKVKE